MAEGFYYDSCGAGRIYAARWIPAGTPRGIVQIVHGIGEHSGRYDTFARWLNERGFAVVAEDHMGHGRSIEDGVKGYFHGGWFSAVADTHRLMQMTMEEFPGVPYFLFGHSMGSFMARTILAKYPDSGITGCIICGTGWQSGALLKVAIPLCKLISRKEGEQNPSMMLQKLVFGGYNKQFKDAETQSDWLSRDKQSVRDYIEDPLCGFVASSGLMRDMLTGIAYIQKKHSLAAMRKDLPVFFIAGGEDPVGSNGAGVRKAADAFRDAGMEDVYTKIYPLCRHELHNELNALEVYDDVASWLEAKMALKIS